MPGVGVGRRSTASTLTIRVNGGSNGGTLTASATNLGRLQKNAGPAFPVAAVPVPAGQSMTYEMNYVGLEASDAADDIVVAATFAENETGATLSSTGRVTSIRLELAAIYEAPENPCTNRHVFGVGEKVLFNVHPQMSNIILSTVKQDVADDESGYELFDGAATNDASVARIYTCPISRNYTPQIRVRHGAVEYAPMISLVEPQMVVTTGAGRGANAVDVFYEGNRMCWPPGCVGEATLVTTNYIGPMSVSFQGIAVSELPCFEEDVITGCFTNGHWRTHTTGAGAGKAYYVSTNNFWFVDAAGSRSFERNWLPDSTLVWKIPIGWHRKDAAYTDWHGVVEPDYERRWDAQSRPLQMEVVYRQSRYIDSEGTFHTGKFGHLMQRSSSCRVQLDGKTIQWSHPQ